MYNGEGEIMVTVNNERMTRQDGDENTKVSPHSSEQNAQENDKTKIADAINNPSGKKERFDQWLNGEEFNNQRSAE